LDCQGRRVVDGHRRFGVVVRTTVVGDTTRAPQELWVWAGQRGRHCGRCVVCAMSLVSQVRKYNKLDAVGFQNIIYLHEFTY
jgi:hypothetical protein